MKPTEQHEFKPRVREPKLCGVGEEYDYACGLPASAEVHQGVESSTGEGLKPCPFCGSTKVLQMEGSTFRWVQMRCSDCEASCGEVRKTDSDNPDLITAWNTRTPATTPTVDALHIAICQAVALMNMEPQQDGNIQAHQILRNALAEYADAQRMTFGSKSK